MLKVYVKLVWSKTMFAIGTTPELYASNLATVLYEDSRGSQNELVADSK